MDLLERQTELGELARLLREAGGSAGKLVFVCGEAGAGKSVLVEQFARHVAGSTRVLWGHSDALQTSRALGPVNEIVAGLSLLANAPRRIGAARDSELARDQLFQQLLDRFSPPNPLLIVVLEDLHWADEATLDFVRFLGRRIQRTRCLLIATYRDDELAPMHLLRAVLGELTGQHTVRIRVPAFSPSAVEQLARGTQRDADHVYRVTGGNPFFVRELLSAPIDTVPETVRDAVLARLMSCTPRAREVAELVALLPGKTEPWLVQCILGDVGAAADDAVARGLLLYHDSALAFRHELGRLAVGSTLPRARAQALHRKIYQSLLDHGADLPQLVHHACLSLDEKAVLEHAPRAALQAARAGAHRQAVAHLETALAHVESLSAPERARLFEMHASECNLTNQFAESLVSAGRALELWRGLGDVAAQGRVHLIVSRQYWKSGSKLSADHHAAEAVALFESLPVSRDLAMAYSARAHLAMAGQLVEDTLDYGRRALDLATQLGDHGLQAHSLNSMGTALLCSGGDGGLDHLQRSLAGALEHDLKEHAGRAYGNLVSSLVRQHSPLAETYVSDGIAYCEMHDVEEYLIYLRACSAWFELNRGQWDRAANIAVELLEHAQTLSIPDRLIALLVLAQVRARRGDPGADPLLDEAARLAAPTGELQRIGAVAVARAELAWYRGDVTGVMREAAEGQRAMERHRDPWMQGALEFWARVADPGSSIPADHGVPYSRMSMGDWAGAAADWQHVDAPYERALALASGPEEALREALEILEPLGAGPLAAIVRQRLRELGVRGIPRGPRASTRGNPAGLTQREVQVLGLLVHGHTNTELAHRLHISAKTIDHHISAILEKLEVRSRTEAVAAAFGLGIVKPSKVQSLQQ